MPLLTNRLFSAHSLESPCSFLLICPISLRKCHFLFDFLSKATNTNDCANMQGRLISAFLRTAFLHFTRTYESTNRFVPHTTKDVFVYKVPMIGIEQFQETHRQTCSQSCARIPLLQTKICLLAFLQYILPSASAAFVSDSFVLFATLSDNGLRNASKNASCWNALCVRVCRTIEGCALRCEIEKWKGSMSLNEEKSNEILRAVLIGCAISNAIGRRLTIRNPKQNEHIN